MLCVKWLYKSLFLLLFLNNLALKIFYIDEKPTLTDENLNKYLNDDDKKVKNKSYLKLRRLRRLILTCTITI